MDKIMDAIGTGALVVVGVIGTLVLVAVLAAGYTHIDECVKPESQPGVVIQVPFREDGVMCYVDRDSGSMSCLPYHFEPEETNNEQP